MTRFRTPPVVFPGDKVRDPMDGITRTVLTVSSTTLLMDDGGLIGLDEITDSDVLLASERDWDGEYQQALDRG